MEAGPIKSESDHRAVLARLEALWYAPLGSREAKELEALAILIEDFERQ